MTRTHYIRLAQTLLLAAAITALAAPSLAHATSDGAPAPDWIERYVAAHPFGHDTAGLGTNMAATRTDVRPDTRDAGDAAAARLKLGDRRAPDTIDIALDGTVVTPANVQPSAFDWQDAGIGASAAVAALALVGGLLLLLTRLHRRPQAQTT